MRKFLWMVAAGILAAGPAGLAADSGCRPPGPDPREIASFVRSGCFEEWSHQKQHLSGARFDGTFYTAHQEIEVFYSRGVALWLAGESSSIPNGEAIVAVETAPGSSGDFPKRYLVKVRSEGFSWDGWYWSSVSASGAKKGRGPGRGPERDQPRGEYGDSSCLACHASANGGLSTFLAADGPLVPSGWKPDPDLVWPDPPAVTRRLPKPLPAPDPGFLRQFGVPSDLPRPAAFPPRSSDHVPARGPNRFATSDQCRGCHNAGQLLSSSRPNMWYPDPAGNGDGSDPTYRNYSPYGEWSASIHALATRDPVWHAEVEAEVAAYPAIKDYIYDTCFSCHGPMAARQLRTDTGDPSARFTLPMFFAHRPGEPGHEYGALARDGISCTACHRITDTDLGVDLPPTMPGDQILSNLLDPFDPTKGFGVFVRPRKPGSYTGQFEIDSTGSLFGPYPLPNGTVMSNATGFDPVGGSDPGEPAAQLGEAALCGSCHTIIVPSVPKGYAGDDPGSDPSLELVFEQTTYWEWRNSFWENESKSSGLPCQGCHMAPHRGKDGRLLQQRIANIESDRFPPVSARLPDSEIHLAGRFPYPRHTFLAINVLVAEMFQQFPKLLGSRLPDPRVPKETLEPLLNASDWMSDHARRDSVLTNFLRSEVETHDGREVLELDLQVSNYAGHKFPSGAAIRRAFIELTVLDDRDRVLWSSGTTNEYGVILDRATGKELTSEWTDVPAKSQPHYSVIDGEDQVQIYENRTVDENGKLQSSVLGIAGDYKDNRILPAGWVVEAPAGGGTFQADRRFPNSGSINMFAIHPRLPLADQPVPAPAGSPDYCSEPGKGLGYDEHYCDSEFTQYGADVVTYRIPTDRIEGWECVQARVLYQSVPPYYLKERLEPPPGGKLGPAAERLAYIASRLNWKESSIKGWTLQVGNLATRTEDGKTRPDPVLRSCRPGGPAATQGGGS